MKTLTVLSVFASIAIGFLFQLQAQDALTNGLVAFYPFKGNANDASGNGNDGAIIGYDFKYSADRFGQPNSLYLNTTSSPSPTLDGLDVIIPRSGALDFNHDFTLTVWVNIPDDLGPYYVHNLISNGPDTNGVNLRVISESDGGLDYLQFVCNHTNGNVYAFMAPLHNGWWQAVVVRSGTNVSLFRNGSLLTYSNITATVPNSPEIWLGRHMVPGLPAGTGSYSLVGGIDEVRFYNRALSAVEVRELYQYEANPLPFLTVVVKTIRLTLFVELGTTNQLDSSTSLGIWTPYGPPFLATNSITDVDVDILGTQQRFFRVRRLIP